MGVSNRLVDAVMKHMPSNADSYVTETEFGGAVLSVHWKLGNDPQRPNKRSKTIVIRLTRELLEDFPNYPPSMQQTAVGRIEHWIAESLKSFDPNHQMSRFQEPPTEEWVISSGDIFT